jgi:signal transduction histidine kinase
MRSNFNCSCMAISSLTFIPFFFFLWNFSFSRFIQILYKLGIFWFKKSPLNLLLKLLYQIWVGLSPFKIVSDSPVLHSSWQQLLKIDISSIIILAEMIFGPLSKLCATPPFSLNFRSQIGNQVSDYRLPVASALDISKYLAQSMIYWFSL